MDKWDRFIESLSTPGGCILLLSFMVILFTLVELRLIFHNSEVSQVMNTTVNDILMGFFGALVQALQSRTKPPNGTSSGAPAPTTETTKEAV